jgi:secreted Zn-dependent insulinase-like peptidase
LTKILKKFIDPKVYDHLRSKQQLGYAVGCSFESYGGILGIAIIVISQEHKHKFTEIYQKINEFLETIIRPAIDEITDEEFENFKDAHIKDLQSEILTLSSEVSDNWDQIDTEYYTFNTDEVNAEVSKQLTKEDLQQFYHSFMDVENQRVLCLQIIGNEMKQEATAENKELNVELITDKFHNNENVITDIDEFQKHLHLYDVVKSFD